MRLPFVFVHGWGTAPNFWDGVIAALPNCDAYRVNLGFINDASDVVGGDPAPAIYVTHSLGTMWALRHRSRDMAGLVAINGFADFRPFTNARVLRAMALRLNKAPKAQMRDFWQAAELPESDVLNIAKLSEGLEWLSTWDLRDRLRMLDCPVMALGGERDAILPINIMRREWDGFDPSLQEDGGHALPLTHPQWCADHILGVADAL